MDRSSFWFGMGEALLVPLVFVALGLAWWGGIQRAEASPAPYPPRMQAEGELWLVDGFNVVQVALLSGRDRQEWWTAPYRAELMTRVRDFEVPGAEVWVAFDGSRASDDAPGPVRAIFVPSADEWLVARVKEAPDPARVRVVTADRRLASRVRHHGAEVVSPGAFLGRCGVATERGEITSI